MKMEMYFQSCCGEEDPYYMDNLYLTHANGFVPQSLNLGHPEVRDNSQKRANQSGTFDFTQHHGASAVQITVALAPELMETPLTETALLDKLKRWTNPYSRSYLIYREQGEVDWRKILIRNANSNRNISLVRSEFGNVSLTFRAPKGISESYEEVTVPLSFNGLESGRTYDLTFDRTYPASNIIGLREVINLGSTEAYPRLRIYGPCSGFRCENVTTGKTLWFKDAFTLLANEYLVIDFEEGTVYMNGDPTNQRYSELKITEADYDWWKLVCGVNMVRAVATTFTSPQAHMDLSYNHSYI